MRHVKTPINTPKKIALASLLAVGTAAIALPALAADHTQHLRGQITSVSNSGFTMSTNNGDKRQIKLSSKTKLAAVTSGDLSNIQKGTFIGTANVKQNGKNQALEMVIFPPSMKGTGLGNYGWDLTPSMVNQSTSGHNGGSGSSKTAGGSMSSGSSMTNGSVSSKSNQSMSSGSSMTNGSVSSKSSQTMNSGSSMTNGSVKQQSNSGQSMTLKVDYGKGTKTIVVPADTPTVKVQPGQKSDLKKGAHVFVAGPKTSGTFNAKMVIVGKNGTVPPM